MSDYKFEIKDMNLIAHSTDETLKRLSELSLGLCRQIVRKEEDIIVRSLPDFSLLQLRDTVLDEIKKRNL